jgi:hypothetical protein
MERTCKPHINEEAAFSNVAEVTGEDATSTIGWLL